jgi:uncharacterized protein (DUF486 family)
VAIKQVSARELSVADQVEARKWLAREAGLLSSLDHELLPELIAAFSEGDDHYIVMPFFEGETLKERVTRAGPLNGIEATYWALCLADVLSYLHCEKPPIIHRDLKPDNVLLLPDHSLVLLDLGVARQLDRGVPGTAIGTPGFAAPEQYQGLADERSDLYGLGATMHYMLTGYDSEQAAPFRHPPVRQLIPTAGPASEALISILLQVVPDERPRSASVVFDILTHIQQASASTWIAANSSWYGKRFAKRTLPLAIVVVVMAATIQTSVLIAFGWTQLGLSSTLLATVAAVSSGLALVALQIPVAANRAVRLGHTELRFTTQVPQMLVALSVFLGYDYALPSTLRWALLPGLVALPYLVLSIVWILSRRSAKRSRLGLEAALQIQLP